METIAEIKSNKKKKQQQHSPVWFAGFTFWGIMPVWNDFDVRNRTNKGSLKEENTKEKEKESAPTTALLVVFVVLAQNC